MRLGLIAAGLLAVSVWHAPAAAAEAVSNTAARDMLAARVYEVAHEIEASRGLASPTIGAATDVAELRRSVDTMSASANSDAAKRKALGLSALIASLERAIAAPGATHGPLIPTRLPAARRFDAGIFDGTRNASCESALALGTDREIDATMIAGGEVWLRFDAPGRALYRVSTDATPLDSEISVFAKCPDTAATKPLASNDDAFGLAATAPVDLRSTPGPWWLRVRNLGSAGSVAIITGTSGTISGRITDIHTGNGIPDVSVTAYSA
ncbi:MAG TPA: hypothetical protein VGO25_10540, partial [Rhodanobacteraceae bacterium]|nr:hypothetical protein [Rhodanobacteraceae bacterium]